MRQNWKRLSGILLSLALVMGLMPGCVCAARADGTTEKTISGLETGTIRNPTGSGQWDYVYYGKYNNNPVKYRVLSIKTTDFGGTTMLLDCDSTLFTAAFDTSNSNSWENSSIKVGLECVSKCREMQFRAERLKTQRVFRSGKAGLPRQNQRF